MNIQTYQQQVTRTFPDLGEKLFASMRKATPDMDIHILETIYTSLGITGKLLDSIHCTLGIGSELNEEVIIALRSGDAVNLGEELADAQWYLANYATVHGIALQATEPFKSFDHLSTRAIKDELDDLQVYLGRLQDYDKRELAYGKPTNEDIRVNTVKGLLRSIEFTASYNGINMDEFRQKVINKLLLRYPLAEGFTTDRAINRDTQSERTILEERKAA